jgi:hypothetical protein
MAKSSDFFILSIVSHDNRVVAKSLADMMNVAAMLKRSFLLNVQSGTGITNSRTKCLEALKKQFHEEKSVYTFWMDSDIVLTEDPAKIVEYILEAEKTGASFTGNYHVIDNETNQMWNVVGKEYPNHYTEEELKSATPFSLKCGYSGMGLCYVKSPVDYNFRTEGHDLEDMFFFKDNKDIDLRYVPISNVHIKSVYI